MASSSVTMAADGWARPGAQYVYAGPAPECRTCRFFKVCQNQEVGRAYRVTAVRNVVHACPISGPFRVVEVEPVPRAVNIGAAQLRGTAVTFEPQAECGMPTCPERARCFPAAMPRGTLLRVVQVGADVTCPVGRALRNAGLEPAR